MNPSPPSDAQPPAPSPNRHEAAAQASAPTPDPRPPRSSQSLIDELLRFVRKGFARVIEFTPTRINLSWITDNLAVGGAFHQPDIARLRRMGIRAIVDCREEAADDQEELRRCGIAYLRLATPDAHGLSRGALDLGVGWVLKRLRRGEKVYIHCAHGVGRGPLLACCVLVADGRTAEDALKFIKARRWQASPNAEQITALVEWSQRRRGEIGCA